MSISPALDPWTFKKSSAVPASISNICDIEMNACIDSLMSESDEEANVTSASHHPFLSQLVREPFQVDVGMGNLGVSRETEHLGNSTHIFEA